MAYKIVAIIFAVFFLITGVLYINEKITNKDIELGKSFENTLACMDGCYNMLETIYDEVDYLNITLENYYIQCSNKCYIKYFATMGRIENLEEKNNEI